MTVNDGYEGLIVNVLMRISSLKVIEGLKTILRKISSMSLKKGMSFCFIVHVIVYAVDANVNGIRQEDAETAFCNAVGDVEALAFDVISSVNGYGLPRKVFGRSRHVYEDKGIDTKTVADFRISVSDLENVLLIETFFMPITEDNVVKVYSETLISVTYGISGKKKDVVSGHIGVILDGGV